MPRPLNKPTLDGRFCFDPAPIAGAYKIEEIAVLRLLGICLGPAFQGKFRRVSPSWRTVGPFLVIEAPLSFDLAPCVSQWQEPMLIQALLPEAAAEAFYETVVGRRAASGKIQFHGVLISSTLRYPSGELAIVVHYCAW